MIIHASTSAKVVTPHVSTLYIMVYAGRNRPKEVPFERFQVLERVGKFVRGHNSMKE